jgi:U3 small nucleolar RNA-associated protein 12
MLMCCVVLMQAKRLIAVAVLDATVKVFHEDTLKFFLSLYGHKVRNICHSFSQRVT